MFGYPFYILTQCGIYFSTFPLKQTILTLIVKLYKTISLKHNLKHNITILSSFAHGFCNILTSDTVNDIDDAHTQRPLPLNKSSQPLPLSTLNEHPLDESFDNSDDPTITSTKLSGMILPPHFLTKRSKRISIMSQF